MMYGNGDNKDARDFAALLEDSNLMQMVSSATHIKGNIIDLVIAPATDTMISDVSVDALLTDHHAIVCHLNLPKPQPVQKQITYRKYCSIDNIKFAQDLATSPTAVRSTAVGNTQTLCEQYNNELSVIIDNHAPLIRRTVNVRPRQPWRTDEVPSTRRQVRQAERKWRHTRLHVHRQIYADLRDAFKKTIAHAKSSNYCGEMASYYKDSKRMVAVAKDLMGCSKQASLPKFGG